EFESPNVNVWGEDTPIGTPEILPQTGEAIKKMAADSPNVLDSRPHTVPQENVENKRRLSTLQKSGRRKSRHSVMFAEGSTNAEHCGIRYPGTPIRNTTRVS
ncbi:unnamed protein product, partial [Meganyctiphanes norvegica]